MQNNYNNRLYESLIYDISKTIKYEINEAYDNQLLEKYDVNDILNKAMQEAGKDSVIIYKQLKKLIVYAIKKLQETNQYKKSEKLMNEYKKRIQKYIDEHKKITPKRLFKITVAVLTIYGGISMVQDCKSMLNSIQNNINQNIAYTDSLTNNNQDNNVNNKEELVELPNELDTVQLSNKVVKDKDVNSIHPSQKYKQDKNFQFLASSDCKDFIKHHEMLLLYPYYATEAEQKQGKVTIGYGHVVIESDGDLYKQVQRLKKQGKIKLSFVKDKTGRQIINPKHCQNIISQKQADNLFEKDIKIAEQRAYNAIKDMNTDNNDVRCYMLYNQQIKDGLISLCYNAGNLKQEKYSFITQGLANCRYDYAQNCINKGDYNVSFKKFKSIKDNPNRRSEEYNLFFVNANKPMKYKS